MNNEKTFCGFDWSAMGDVLNTLCEIEDRIEMTEEEANAFEIGIQSVVQIMNRMKDGELINWD